MNRPTAGSRNKSAHSSGAESHPRVDVLGVEVSAVDMATAVSSISQFIEVGDREYVCVTGVHGVMESQRDSRLLQIHNDAGLTAPDGMPLVWAGKWAGSKNIERVYGPALLLELCRAGLDPGWKHFFYGGGDDVADDLARVLADRYPGLKVAGVHTPPFRPLTQDEIDHVVALINRVNPDIVWVGLSTPKQERWMASMRPRLQAPVLIGVGAAFDIHSGRTSQAPEWMQQTGLEWLYRLVKEPRRLWRRYLRNNPSFAFRILLKRPRLIATVTNAAHTERGGITDS